MPRVSTTGEIDPDSKQKDKDEAELARRIAELLAEQEVALTKKLDKKDPRSPDNEWWDERLALLVTVLVPFLTGTALRGAERSIERIGIGVPWDQVVGAVNEWSNSYGYDLVKDINDTSRKWLDDALTRYYNKQTNFDGLVAELETHYSPVRAASIARTEVQRGYAMGADIHEEGLRDLGLVTDQLWNTEKDPCPICAPNAGKLRERDGWTRSQVPAHPNCRCWTTIVVAESV